MKNIQIALKKYVEAANKDDESDDVREAYCELCHALNLDPGEMPIESVYGARWKTIGVQYENVRLLLKS